MTESSHGRWHAHTAHARAQRARMRGGLVDIGLMGLLGFAATGCATDTKSQHGNAAATEPVNAAAPLTNEPSAVEPPATHLTAAPPKPERLGLDAKVLWTAPQPESLPPGTQCGMSRDTLSITQVRVDDNWLYVDTVHRSAFSTTEHPETPPTMVMRLDGCPAPAPRASGRVWYDWATPSTLTIALADLPDGELDIGVRAFGGEAVAVLQKVGRRMTPLREEDRAGVVLIPEDPARGQPAAISYPDRECPEEVVR